MLQPNPSLQTDEGRSGTERDPKNHYPDGVCCKKVSLLEQSVVNLSGQVDFLLSYLYIIRRTNVQPNNIQNRNTSMDAGAAVETGSATEQTELKAKHKTFADAPQSWTVSNNVKVYPAMNYSEWLKHSDEWSDARRSEKGANYSNTLETKLSG